MTSMLGCENELAKRVWYGKIQASPENVFNDNTEPSFYAISYFLFAQILRVLNHNLAR